MKRVLVTGGSGFIGRQCLPLLKERGYEVYGISFKKPPRDTEGVNWIPFDLLETHGIDPLLAAIQPTHLLHFAWIVTPGVYRESRENLTWLQASIKLVKAFVLHGGKRAVFSGTCAEYDWKAPIFDEGTTPCLPQTLYGSSKLALQQLLESLAKPLGLSHAWGRVFHLYGPHEYPQRFVPSVINGLLHQRHVSCSHGNQLRDFLHVQDVADAFALLLDSEIEGVVNIGSGVGVTLKQVIQCIAQRLGGLDLIQFGALSHSENEPASLIPRVTRLKSELGWHPRFSLEEGLENTISWWEAAITNALT